MATRFKSALIILSGVLCLIIDAFYNGYPIVYSDTSTYLASGFKLEAPIDRPITYGLFIRLTSLNGFSLWLTVFFQALLLSYLLYLFFKHFVGEAFALKYSLPLILFLSLFTGISWTSSQLLTDIFTPIAVLSLILILFGNIKKRQLIFLFIVYCISICMHISHVLFFSILLVLIFILKKWLFDKESFLLFYKHAAILFVITIASILTMGAAIAKSKDVFFMGAMVEQGITKQYLDEYCGSHHYKLCRYKDSLPKTSYQFVWDTNSPFYKTGGWSAENKQELHDIIYATLTKPKYILLHINASLKATLLQLTKFEIGDGNGVFLKGSSLYSRIAKYAPHDKTLYEDSRQNKGEFLYITTPNIVYNIVIMLSAILLCCTLIMYRKVFEPGFIPVVIIILFSILINAWDTGTFSCVAHRFGCKMMWLLPLLATISIYKAIGNRKPAQAK